MLFNIMKATKYIYEKYETTNMELALKGGQFK